jgi:hypothetical protein
VKEKLNTQQQQGRTIKVVKLFLQQEAGHGLGQVLGHTLSGSVGTVGSAKGVVHVHVSVGSQL